MKSLIWKEWRENFNQTSLPSILILGLLALYGEGRVHSAAEPSEPPVEAKVPLTATKDPIAQTFTPDQMLTDFRIAREAL